MAVITDDIAKVVINDTNAKQFTGKDQVVTKKIDLKLNSSFDLKPAKNMKKTVESKVKVDTKEDDEWENF